MDSLFFGVLISYFHQYHRERIEALSNHRLIFLAAGLGILLLRFTLHADNQSAWTFGFTELYLAYGLILLSVLTVKPSEGLLGKMLTNPTAKAIAFVGLYSYSIYLWHFQFAGPFVMDKVLPHLPDSIRWGAGMLIYVALAVLTGVLAAHIIEIPVLVLRDKFFPSSVAAKSAPTIQQANAS
jgi:peptidoglycan/LPS O-acetylase OafA/YrhL